MSTASHIIPEGTSLIGQRIAGCQWDKGKYVTVEWAGPNGVGGINWLGAREYYEDKHNPGGWKLVPRTKRWIVTTETRQPETGQILIYGGKPYIIDKVPKDWDHIETGDVVVSVEAAT